MGVTALTQLGDLPVADGVGGGFVPHVVAWNLTRRCNLECAHCYIAAGPQETATGELATDECLRIAGEILPAFGPSAVAGLRETLNVKGDESHARRLLAICRSDPAGSGEVCLRAVPTRHCALRGSGPSPHRCMWHLRRATRTGSSWSSRPAGSG